MIISRSTPPVIVTPAKAGARLFFCDGESIRTAEKGSQAPDQVRGDELGTVGQ